MEVPQNPKMTPLQPLAHHRKEYIPNTSAIGMAETSSLSQKDQSGRSSSTQNLSSNALEAKRATNRQSARRCRLRQKMLIKDLENRNSLLTMENTNLRLKLELAQAENKRMVLMQQQEQQRVFRRSQALHGILKKQFQDQSKTPTSVVHPQSATTVSALLELAGQSPPTSPKTPELVHYTSRSRPLETELQVTSPPRFPELGPLPSSRLERRLPPTNISPRYMLDTQQEIQHLREEVKGLRDFLSRHSI